MADYRGTESGSKRWRARRTYRGYSYFLGWFTTREEAVSAEVKFMERRGWDNSRSAVVKRANRTRALTRGQRRESNGRFRAGCESSRGDGIDRQKGT